MNTNHVDQPGPEDSFDEPGPEDNIDGRRLGELPAPLVVVDVVLGRTVDDHFAISAFAYVRLMV